jgi:hypothetical protein
MGEMLNAWCAQKAMDWHWSPRLQGLAWSGQQSSIAVGISAGMAISVVFALVAVTPAAGTNVSDSAVTRATIVRVKCIIMPSDAIYIDTDDPKVKRVYFDEFPLNSP